MNLPVWPPSPGSSNIQLAEETASESIHQGADSLAQDKLASEFSWYREMGLL
jgi:hypothetical protein